MLGQFITARSLGRIEDVKGDHDTHVAATTGIHGAVSAATANKLVIRDASGRFQAADPSAAADVATKGWVEGLGYQFGTVTAVTGSNGVSSTGGTTPDLSLTNTGVAAAQYTNATVTVDVKGRVTAIESGQSTAVTDLGYVQNNATTLEVTSSSGLNTNLPAATTSFAGMFAAADKIKLNGIDTSANLYVHPSYSAETNTLTGAQVISVINSDATGHITSITTRTLTAADIGAGTGSVTSVGTTTGLSGTVTTSGNLSLALQDLADGVDNIIGSADEIIYLDAGVQKRKQVNEWNLGQFNNDQGWTSNAGTVTSVGASSPIASSGGTSPTISVNLNNLTDMGTTNMIGTDQFVVLDGGVQKRKTMNDIQLSLFDDDLNYGTGDITSVEIIAGTALTGGGLDTTGSVSFTLNVDLGTGASQAAAGNHTHAYSAIGHTHTGTEISNLDAGDTTTGVFAVARIPTSGYGTITASGFTVSSALRLKNVVDQFVDDPANLFKLAPVVYVLKDDETERQQLGYIAEYVDELYPELVTKDEFGDVLGIDYAKLVVPIISKMREQDNRIKILERMIH